MASHNELKLRVAQVRKQKLKEAVVSSPISSALISPDAVKYWKQEYKSREKLV